MTDISKYLKPIQFDKLETPYPFFNGSQFKDILRMLFVTAAADQEFLERLFETTTDYFSQGDPDEMLALLNDYYDENRTIICQDMVGVETLEEHRIINAELFKLQSQYVVLRDVFNGANEVIAGLQRTYEASRALNKITINKPASNFKVCIECGNTFEAAAINQEYCSPQCRKKASNRRHKEKYMV